MANERNKGKQEQKAHKLNDKLAAFSLLFALFLSFCKKESKILNSASTNAHMDNEWELEQKEYTRRRKNQNMFIQVRVWWEHVERNSAKQHMVQNAFLAGLYLSFDYRCHNKCLVVRILIGTICIMVEFVLYFIPNFFFCLFLRLHPQFMKECVDLVWVIFSRLVCQFKFACWEVPRSKPSGSERDIIDNEKEISGQRFWSYCFVYIFPIWSKWNETKTRFHVNFFFCFVRCCVCKRCALRT